MPSVLIIVGQEFYNRTLDFCGSSVD